MNRKSLRVRQLGIAACCAAAWPSIHAQTNAQAPADTSDTTQRVTITGSNIRGLAAESELPVQVITANDIAHSGKDSITEILSTLTIAGANGLTDTQSFGSFAYGSSGVSLRGLGPTATLILINGRRIAPYSVPDIGKGLTSFVNVDAIPKAAIERIEILKDGASAIYGSDAMAGVINIILRPDFTGGELTANVTANEHNQYRSKDATIAYGLGNLSNDGYNGFVSLDFYKRDKVMLHDVQNQVIDSRSYNSDFYYTGRPYTQSYSPYPNFYKGVTIDPATGTAFVASQTGVASPNCPAGNSWAFNSSFTPPLALCGYDYWGKNQYITPLSRESLFSRGQLRVNGTTNAFAELSYTHTSNVMTDWPVPFGSGRSATPNGRDGGVSYVPNYLPAGNPSNPFPDQDTGIRYLFTDVGPQITDSNNHTLRALVGLSGTWKDWDWETGLLYALDMTTVSYPNRVSLPVLRDAVLNGTYDFNDPSAGSITAKDLRIDPKDHGRSSFAQLDVKASSELMQLPGGPMALAVGSEFREERRNYTPDPRIYDGEVYLQVAGQTSGSRNVSTVYSELSLPFVKSVNVQLAARVDHYSDYGTSATPKLAASWTPTDWLKFRGSATKGFRAPSLNEVGSSNTPFFNFISFDPKRCGIYKIDCDGYQDSGQAVASHNLKAETSMSQSLGLVLEPIKNLTFAFDYWNIDRKNEIVYLDQTELITNEDSTNPLYAGRIQRLPDDTVSIPGQTIPGRISTVELQFLNRGRTQVSGVDLDVNSLIRLGDLGRLTLGSSVTYTQRYRTRTDDASPWVNYGGTLDYPRVRGEVSANWERGDWALGGKVNYLSGFLATIPGQACEGEQFLGACKVSSYTTLDLWTAYTWMKTLTFNASVRNVANRRMPFVPVDSTGDLNLYNPAGRLFSLSASYRF